MKDVVSQNTPISLANIIPPPVRSDPDGWAAFFHTSFL